MLFDLFRSRAGQAAQQAAVLRAPNRPPGGVRPRHPGHRVRGGRKHTLHQGVRLRRKGAGRLLLGGQVAQALARWVYHTLP